MKAGPSRARQDEAEALGESYDAVSLAAFW